MCNSELGKMGLELNDGFVESLNNTGEEGPIYVDGFQSMRRECLLLLGHLLASNGKLTQDKILFKSKLWSSFLNISGFQATATCQLTADVSCGRLLL